MRQAKADLSSLTMRERDVLNRVAEGRANHVIAHELGISPRTVQKHLQRIYAKLGVKGRTAAAVFAIQQNARDAGRRNHDRRNDSAWR